MVQSISVCGCLPRHSFTLTASASYATQTLLITSLLEICFLFFYFVLIKSLPVLSVGQHFWTGLDGLYNHMVNSINRSQYAFFLGLIFFNILLLSLTHVATTACWSSAASGKPWNNLKALHWVNVHSIALGLYLTWLATYLEANAAAGAFETHVLMHDARRNDARRWAQLTPSSS